ncbi:MAG: efflux RND transporter periplasmic adaptor subunit [Candidatus Aminicenantaceae bacterium]
MKKYVVLSSLLIFLFCGRGDKKAVPEEQDIGLESEEHAHQELRISPEVQKQWGITVSEVSEIRVSSKITLPGVLDLNKNKTAYISSFAEGKAVSLSVDLGDTVRKGKTLLIINSPEFAQAQAAFLQARARFILSQKEYERAKMLLSENAIEQKEYLRRESEYQKASTEVGVRGSNLHSFGLDHDQIDKLIEKCESLNSKGYLCEVTDPHLSILAPLDGKIIFRDIIVGDHIEPEKILFTVSDLSILWAILDAYEKDLPFIRKQSKISIKSSLYPEENFAGRITYISDMIDEKLRTVKVRAEVINKEHLLKPNMFIQGIIENTAEAKELIAVPEEAIQNMDGEKIVFIVEEENVFAARQVKLGERIGSQRVIAQGLEKGENIVIKGTFSLKAELTKKSFGSAHVH